MQIWRNFAAVEDSERNEWQRSSGCKTFSRPKWIEPVETRALSFIFYAETAVAIMEVTPL